VEADDRRAKRNVAVLFFAQATVGAQLPINLILGGLAGAVLAENVALATLPLSMMVLAAMFTAPVASHFMGYFGRRTGFLTGVIAGAVGGALSAWAVFIGSFELLLVGTACTGIYQGFQGFYRFAAADTASDAFKPKAISWVLAGGLVSAILGPEVVQMTSDSFAGVPFAGAYVAVVAISLVGGIGLLFLEIPAPARREKGAPSGRSLGEILRQPQAITAILCGMISYALMALVMTSTPLALIDYGFSSNQAADVVRWHALAMYAPSFVTGSLISRFGHLRVITTGLVLFGASGATALSGVELPQFYLALVALGLGWNFSFIGATSLLATAHTLDARAKVQGLNDFLVFGLVATASFSSGALLSLYGWATVQFAMAPGLLVAGAALCWLSVQARAPKLPI